MKTILRNKQNYKVYNYEKIKENELILDVDKRYENLGGDNV